MFLESTLMYSKRRLRPRKRRMRKWPRGFGLKVPAWWAWRCPMDPLRGDNRSPNSRWDPARKPPGSRATPVAGNQPNLAVLPAASTRGQY